VFNRQKIGLVVLALFLAAIFFRLGVWQLDRAQLLQELAKPQKERAVVELLSVAEKNVALSTDALNRIVKFRGTFIDNLQAPNQEDVNGKKSTWSVGVFQVTGSGKIVVVRGIHSGQPKIDSKEVEITGRLMPSQINNKFGEVRDGFLPRIDSALLLSDFGSDFFDGYVIVRSEIPESGLEKVPTPQPIIKVAGFYWQHISYVIVWWLMGLLTLALPFLRSRSSEN
jgi:cytochrome oxidase assembly protein ShyY1